MQPKTDELTSISNTDLTEADIDVLLQQAMELRVSDVLGSINLTNQAKEYCQKNNDVNGLAKCDSQLGLFYMILGRNDEALSHSNAAHDVFEELDDKTGMADALYTIGSVHYKSSNHHIGLEHLYKCLRIRQETGDLAGQSRVLKAIGYIYETFDDRDKAMETYLECRKISQSIGDKDSESNACNVLTNLYLKKDDYENALECINLSIKYKLDTGDTRGLAFAYYGKGKVHLKLKEYAEAEKNFSECLSMHVKVGERLGNGLCQVKLGQLFFEQNELNKAKIYLKNAVAVGDGMDNLVIRYKAYYLLFQIAMQEQNESDALKYHIEYHKNREGIIGSESTTKLKSLDAMWKMESLEAEAKAQREKNELIQKKNAELDKFASRVSHDLRGPISSLLGLYDVVKDEVSDVSSMRYFDMYHNRIQRLNQTIVDILELSKVKEWQLSKSNIDFDQMIKDCLDSFDYLPNYGLIDFRIKIQPNIDVTSDRVLLNTILQNLIENGIKYSKPNYSDAYVAIEVGVENHMLHISVEDNGVGIDKKYQSKVFDMFYRAHEQVQGSGLGMYILSNAVAKLEGRVDLRSEVGEGTCFEVEIPLSKD